MTQYLISFDQGTTSSRAVIFNDQGQLVAMAQHEFQQSYPSDGWVEHDPEEIWQTTIQSAREAIAKAGINASQIISAGITNQRETTIIWNRQTGRAIYPAIVWQDRRTAALCDELKQQQPQLVDSIQQKTGLLLDPYFSATKVGWILDQVEGARQQAANGELAFGTIDSYLMWHLTGGKVHATDATNASRTMLFNIHKQAWDDELLALFNIPAELLPVVKDCSADYGVIDSDLFGYPIDIGGVIGDQQSALVGQGCIRNGMLKSTYGTGCFVIVNTGEEATVSSNRLITTVGYRLNNQVSYALEGSIFMAGATIQWIRDGLKLIANAHESQQLAEQTGYQNPVYMVPAFTGLGAPYWDPHARGAIMGLSRDTGIKEIVTAGLQAVCYQTEDLLVAIRSDGVAVEQLRVDGGMVVNDWLMQFLADVTGIEITRPRVTETTALGAALMAGIQAGLFNDLPHACECWQIDQCFSPLIENNERLRLYQGWKDAVRRVSAAD